MGIKQLLQVLNEKAPCALRQVPLDHYSGRVLACDASMTLYQFLISTYHSQSRGQSAPHYDEIGVPTSPLIGLFNRTVQLLENGVKPVWVFDGRPAAQTEAALFKHRLLKDQLKQRAIHGEAPEAAKHSRRSIHLTPEVLEDGKKMLRLMGLPVVEAPAAAEAQCAELVKAGKAFAVLSEDMDSLTFGAKFLIRNLSNRREPVQEISLDEVLRALDFTFPEFVDYCILLGCDYCSTIERLGPVSAYKLVQQFCTLETIVHLIETGDKVTSKYKMPKNFEFQRARDTFCRPAVHPPEALELGFSDIEEDRLREFLVLNRGFNQMRVDGGLEKIRKTRKKATQLRLESFFVPPAIRKPEHTAKAPTKKRRK